MPTRRNPRSYDDEFKKRAVQMVLDGRGVNAAAQDLDIPRSCLQRWKKQMLDTMDSSLDPEQRSATELDADNRRLRKELAYMTEQRDILKKTIRIFGEDEGRVRRWSP